MPDRAGTLQRIAVELARLLRPIASRLSDEDVLATFADLGVRFPPAFLTQPQISAARSTVTGAAASLDSLMVDLATAIESGDTGGMIAKGTQVINQCGQLVTSFGDLRSAIQSAGPSLPGISGAQISALTTDLPRKLLDLLIAEALEISAPVGAVLGMLGVIERVAVAGDPANPTKPGYDKLSVHLGRLLPAISNPLGHLGSLYGWGGGGLDATKLLTVLEGVLGRVGFPVFLEPAGGGHPVRLQAFALDLEPTTSGSPPGLRLEVALAGALDRTFDFPISPPTWGAHVAVKGALPVGTTGTLRPPFEVELTPPKGSLTGSVTVSVDAKPTEPFVIIGQPEGSRLEFAALSFAAGLALSFASGKATGAPTASGRISGGKLVVDASKGDSFLTTLLGGGRIESTFDLGFLIDPATGTRFDGSGSLEIQIPVHVSIGPIEVQAIYLLASIKAATVPLELSAGFSAQLGPLRASVDRLGVIATLGFPDGGGNVGPAQLDFAFKPPNGVGLAVDAGIVKGGGFLYIDADKGEYAGALELQFAGFLTLKAIGLITTRMPDGSPGFSLLVIITAEFGSGIQLGFGFTLLAVGGLVGLNRTMQLQPLMEGVRTGSIESVMFPQDVIANAPRIISDLRTLFPPKADTFLIGPMAKLGWGTPTLISVSLGVIIEIPGNIAILGVIKVALPADDIALLVLQVNFAGAIEFDRKRLYFFASLFESRVLWMTIDGEFGLLLGWGDDANFVLSVGGFHPSYSPPPLPFPSPKRVAFDILNSSTGKIRVTGYFAVTSNSVQFGAHVYLVLGFSDFGLEGHLGFDALFRFSPFGFVIEISASIALKAFGVGLFSVSLRFALEGTSPWRARGSGSISVLFFEISADFDITWGEARDTTLPPIDVLPMLSGELSKLEHWQAQLPSGTNLLVSLRPLPPADTLVLHPVGTLRVRQQAIPLDLTLDKVGSQKPRDANRFSVDIAPGPPNGFAKVGTLNERFAMAQFTNLDDAAKMSRPAFEPAHGGLEIAVSGASIASSRATRRSARYEQIIIDTNYRRFVMRFVALIDSLFRHFLRGNAISRSALSLAQRRLRQPFEDTIKVSSDQYVVAATRDNAASTIFASQAMAHDHLRTTLAANPELTGSLHVIPAAEAVLVSGGTP